jgi:deoxyribonuclease V
MAKSLFYSNKKFVKELIRGSSKKPIFVSAIGMDPDLACERIKSMKGDSRIPSLLRILDRKTKEL